jgi:DNA-binding MarR family transcriptional regulator
MVIMTRSNRKEELLLLRQLVEPAFFLLLLLRLGQLPTKVSLARIMGMDRRKVARMINILIDLGFVRYVPAQSGYLLNRSLTQPQQKIIRFFNQSQGLDYRWLEELSQILDHHTPQVGK